MAVAIVLGGLCQSQARLAITEVMSKANSSQPDWWELTNLGTNDVNLTGYCWNDDSHGGFSGAFNVAEFNGVVIHTNESIIFSESGGTVTTAIDFRAWWGISPSVQVVILASGGPPGLSSGGDSVRLWSTNLMALAGNTNGLDLDNCPEYLVDRADIVAATTGSTFYYNTNDGKFDIVSTNGVNGAFQAATGGDIGSPGVALNVPAPVVIASQPTNVLVAVGGTATFTVSAYGLPKPRFQWLLNGLPVDTSRVSTVYSVVGNYSVTTLTITNVQVADGGTFRTVASNGFDMVVSSNAVLSVNTDPLAPLFTQKPVTNLYAYVGQTVTFTAGAFGNPPPTFLWQFNSNTIIGENDAQYSFYLTDTNQTGIYTVIATNSVGSTNVNITLTVTPKPNLRITEVCTLEATNSAGSSGGHNDWWELSNLGDFTFHLQGCRFDDNSFSLSQAYTITNDVSIAPGETMIFVEDMTPEDFRAWWGEQNLRAGLQIIPYHGSALSFSATSGDSLTLWNAATTTEGDFIDSLSLAANPASPDCHTFVMDPVSQIFWGTVPTGLSEEGVNGSFAAAGDVGFLSTDIGSPGTILNVPKITSVTSSGSGCELSWFTQPDWTNLVQYKTNLANGDWINLTSFVSTSTNATYLDSSTDKQRFYRVKLPINP